MPHDEPASPDFSALTSSELMAICDRFWEPASIEYGEFVSANNELWKRGGPEIRDWCRKLLIHPDYWARETGAGLLGELAQRKQLGDGVQQIIVELGALARRVPEEDCKEAQAVDVAVDALAKIGHADGIPHVCAVLFSEDEMLGGDSNWSAAEALGTLTGQSFMGEDDPVEAARAWVRRQPQLKWQ